MVTTANLGFPRIGPHRELKWAVEAYWGGRIDRDELLLRAAELRRVNWEFQRDAGITHIPSNDFSLYDHVLDTSVMVGAVPPRYGAGEDDIDLDTYFTMARGRADSIGKPGVQAMEMTKWFDTNYHYLVPELHEWQRFSLRSTKVIDEFLEARALGIHTRPVLVGPLTYLLISKSPYDGLDTLSLLDGLLDVYAEVLRKLAAAGATWVQVDEPGLGLDLTKGQLDAYAAAYERLTKAAPTLKIMLTTYFSDLRENMRAALALPVQGIHLDLVRGRSDLNQAISLLPADKTLSLGLVDGRNVWKSDLAAAIETARAAVDVLGSDRVVIAPSCSLLHCPVDLEYEEKLDDEIKSWMAFAKQKVREVATIASAIEGAGRDVETELEANAAAIRDRATSPRIHSPAVKERSASVTEDMLCRQRPYEERRVEQLELPDFPTTTIGSFPQTAEIRRARASHNRGEITDAQYEQFLKGNIAEAVRIQEGIGLDVLVHGEAERNDMVEYFGEQLLGYVSTANGWVQSYGSRCAKPPVIYGDISRPAPLTLRWITYAQSLTDLPMKGMLTGPVTMLEWSFVRDDQPRSETCRQLALAIRDEVLDLESLGINVVQVDEPALREGLPLRKADWDGYLSWAVDSFRLATAGVQDRTQIHTHMCYVAYDDITDSIARMDADVISMENARSDGEALRNLQRNNFPNEVGPGVFDIHSPRVPDEEEMAELLWAATQTLQPGQRLWVNPDCGLKTRRWEEVIPSLRNMVSAAKAMRGAVRANR